MCFPSFPFVTHVLLSPWLTFHLLQVPFLGGRRALAQVGLPKHSLATWNYRAFKAHTSCPSEIHWAYQKAPLPPPKCRMTRFWHICLYWKPLPLFWSTVYWSSLDGGNYLNNKPTKMSPPWIQSCSPDRCQRQHLESIMRQEIKKKRGQKDKQIFLKITQSHMKKGKAFSRLVEISLAGGEYAPASGASRLAAACQLFCLPSTKCPRDVPSEVSNKTNLPLPLPPAPVIIDVIVRACPSHSGTK